VGIELATQGQLNAPGTAQRATATPPPDRGVQPAVIGHHAASERLSARHLLVPYLSTG
jgi:hypothetical protein